MKRQTLTLCLVAGGVLLLIFLANSDTEGGLGGSGGGSSRPVKQTYENQDRNGLCWKTKDCLSGLICEGATREKAGKCTFVCHRDSDCGNGYLCRDDGCQRDCAEIGEKCSPRRACCFYDNDNDDVNDAECEIGRAHV